jgi:peroxisomal 3,2-trans-enoyl-CoA isomerase
MASLSQQYPDIEFTIKNKIGIIKVRPPFLPMNLLLTTFPQQFNRPKALNSFGGSLIPSTIAALRFLNTHPDTVFTVLTGEGRFFSAGADVKGVAGLSSGVCFQADGLTCM